MQAVSPHALMELKVVLMDTLPRPKYESRVILDRMAYFEDMMELITEPDFVRAVGVGLRNPEIRTLVLTMARLQADFVNSSSAELLEYLAHSIAYEPNKSTSSAMAERLRFMHARILTREHTEAEVDAAMTDTPCLYQLVRLVQFKALPENQDSDMPYDAGICLHQAWNLCTFFKQTQGGFEVNVEALKDADSVNNMCISHDELDATAYFKLLLTWASIVAVVTPSTRELLKCLSA